MKFTCIECGKVKEAEARLVLSGRKKFCSRSCCSRYTANKTWKSRGPVTESQDEERFWVKVNKKGPIHPKLKTRCWVWTVGLFSNGYGQFWRVSGSMPAHRYSWSVVHGEIPETHQICHHCDNPLCVNPKHLFLGTAQSNKDDCVSKSRHAKGEKVNTASITEETVREIRRLKIQLYSDGKPYPLKRLCKLFPDVSRGIIESVIYNFTWRSVK